MWSVLGWFKRRRLARRELLRFWDGAAWRYADPFQAWRRLSHHATIQIDAHWKAADRGDEPETTELVLAIAEVFDLRRWDGIDGLTDWEVLDVFARLMGYLDDLKKKHNPSPTSSPPTDSGSSTSPAVPPATANSGSDST